MPMLSTEQLTNQSRLTVKFVGLCEDSNFGCSCPAPTPVDVVGALTSDLGKYVKTPVNFFPSTNVGGFPPYVFSFTTNFTAARDYLSDVSVQMKDDIVHYAHTLAISVDTLATTVVREFESADVCCPHMHCARLVQTLISL